MFIEDYAKKQLFGSLDKNKLPANLVEYNCDLVIEDYTQVAHMIARVVKHHSVVTSNSHPSPTPKQNHSLSKSIQYYQSKISSIHIRLLKNKEKMKANFCWGKKWSSKCNPQ